MPYTDYVSPSRVFVALVIGVGLVLLVAVAQAVFPGMLPGQLHLESTWRLLTDLVALLSLLITLAILQDVRGVQSELDEIQNKYLFQATAPELKRRLKERRDELSDLISSPQSQERDTEIRASVGKADVILREVEELAQNDQVEARVSTSRTAIQNYRSDQPNPDVDPADILIALETVGEEIDNLIRRSKHQM